MAPWPQFDEQQISAVSAMLRSAQVNAWTGPYVGQFEEAYAAFLGVKHAIAVANGTAALELALYALELAPGDEVIVTPRSFIASASCVPFCGGVPVFADVDRDSQNITVESIASKVTPRTRGIICVHLAGWPCDMPELMSFARSRGLWVIEDCAQAHGAEVHGQPVGSFGDVATFSFCQDKIITTGGEGGLIATNGDLLWQRAWSRKDHGKSMDAVRAKSPVAGFRWLHESIGTNLRMMSYQAVLGLHQLRKLPEWRAAREANAHQFVAACSGLEALRVPVPASGFRHAYYRFYAFVDRSRLKPGIDRDAILARLGAAGLTAFSGSCSEIYLEKAFDGDMRPAERLPVARELGETSLAFLVDPSLSVETAARHAAILHDVVADATLRPRRRRYGSDMLATREDRRTQQIVPGGQHPPA